MYTTKKYFDYEAFHAECGFDLAKHSSIGCGGMADIVFYPTSIAELTELLKKLEKDGIPYYVLGNMSNVLPSDSGTARAIVRLRKINGVVCEKGAFAYAGASSKDLLNACKTAGLGGAEFLYGIPCTIGGAVFMNAGAGERYIAEIIENVLVYRKGEIKTLSVKECGYSYKKSVFMENGDVIIGCLLRLEKTDAETIAKNVQLYAERRRHLPKGRSMGCTFKNPQGAFAGDLIEKCGLKGLKIGGTYISKQHANFIINEGGATAQDVRALIEKMKGAVRIKFGIELQEEIRYLD